MKKNLLIAISLAFILSCSDDDTPDKPDKLTVSESVLKLDYEASEKTVTFSTKSTNEVSIAVDEAAKEWCIVEKEGKNLKISLLYNNSPNERSTSIVLSVDDQSAEISVTQSANEFYISDDVLLKVSGGEVSSEQAPAEAFEKSYDGDLSSMWHSKYNDKGNFPVTAIWNLENADVLDYVMYYPRSIGSNGRLGKIEIWVSTEAKQEFEKLMDYDCDQKGITRKIEFDKPIVKPKSVKFIINSGLGGFASCAEMQFYKKSEKNNTKYIDIPVANTGYTEPDEYKNNVTQSMKLVHSTKLKSLGKIYFQITEAGKAQLHLKIRNVTEGKKIKVTLGNKINSEIDVPITSTYEWLKIATTDLEATKDFSCLILENLNDGDVDIEAVRIIGKPSENVVYNRNPEGRKNAVSVHLGYQLETFKDVEWFYNEVTIPKGFDEPYHSYYMVNGWGKGYSGIQVRDKTGKNSKRWLIFSCWNTDESGKPESFAKVEKYGKNVVVESFGGEGTGAKTYLELDWVTEKTYQFLLHAKVVGTSAYISLFWKEKTETEWIYQATILSPNNPKYLSGLYSFVENYIGSDGHHQRKANFANQWVKNSTEWKEITKARFTTDGSYKYRTDVGSSVLKNSFYLWNGGFLAQENEVNGTLTREASGTGAPVSDADLVKLDAIANVL